MGEARTSQLVHVAILWALFPEVGAGALAPHAACARSRTSCRCQMGSSVPTSSVRGVEWCWRRACFWPLLLRGKSNSLGPRQTVDACSW